MNVIQDKYVDGVKYRKYLKDNKLNSTEICEKAGIHPHYASNVTAPSKSLDGDGFKCRTNAVYWNLICDSLGLPRDYFDYKEPAPETIEEPERSGNFTAIENYLDEYMPRVADVKELNSTLIELLARVKGIETLLARQNELLDKKSAAIIKSQAFNTASGAWQRINGEK